MNQDVASATTPDIHMNSKVGARHLWVDRVQCLLCHEGSARVVIKEAMPTFTTRTIPFGPCGYADITTLGQRFASEARGLLALPKVSEKSKKGGSGIDAV